MEAYRWKCMSCGFVVMYGVPQEPPSHCRVCGQSVFGGNDSIEAQHLAHRDNVNSPSHYTNGEIEVIDYIKDKLTGEEFVGYCLGNVLKYVSRHRFKGGKEDLEKAAVYLNWAIENYSSG